MKQFVRTQRDPIYRKLINKAAVQVGPNIIKSLTENGYYLSEYDLIVMV